MYVSTVIFLTCANSLHHVEILQFEIHDFMLLTIFSKTINNKNQLNGSVEKLIVFVKIMYYRLVVIVWFLARCRGWCTHSWSAPLSPWTSSCRGSARVFCSAHRRIRPLLLDPARLISENIGILKQLPILRLVETLSALDCLTEQRIRAEGGNLSQVRPRSGTIVCKNVWVSPSPALPSPAQPSQAPALQLVIPIITSDQAPGSWELSVKWAMVNRELNNRFEALQTCKLSPAAGRQLL